MLHICDDKECPSFGQPSSARSCRCHKTELQMLREALAQITQRANESGTGEMGLIDTIHDMHRIARTALENR